MSAIHVKTVVHQSTENVAPESAEVRRRPSSADAPTIRALTPFLRTQSLDSAPLNDPSDRV